MKLPIKKLESAPDKHVALRVGPADDRPAAETSDRWTDATWVADRSDEAVYLAGALALVKDRIEERLHAQALEHRCGREASGYFCHASLSHTLYDQDALFDGHWPALTIYVPRNRETTWRQHLREAIDELAAFATPQPIERDP